MPRRSGRFLRPVLAAVATVLLVTIAPAVAPAIAAGPAGAVPHDPADPSVAIQRAGRLLDGGARTQSGRVDVTLAMRDLFLARPRLGFIDSLQADVLLARPTDGGDDMGGDGYRGGSEKICGKRLCIHYTTGGPDAPRNRAWVERTLKVMAKVWDHHVGGLGMSPPPPDGERGGDRRYDIYLAELGDRGLFGYCAPERRVPGERLAASSYCVLDNDFARKQYAAAPRSSLKVTAAHEFFHAIQFGYDFREDPWLLESTATWVEERFADGTNDNRRYLRYGTLRKPRRSLDEFSNTAYVHYGNWVFWEFLSRRYGADVVAQVWARADARRGAPNDYSVEALAAVLEPHGGLRSALAAYETANLDPAANYPEGAAWPRPKVRIVPLGPGDDREKTVKVDHLAARHVGFAPDGVRGRRARLVVDIDAPGRKHAPAVRVTVRRSNGGSTTRVVRLDRTGAGTVSSRFDVRRVESVVVTLVNASTRYWCDEDSLLACGGVPKDDDEEFRVSARVVD